jgi:ubiquinone/menaquinone biosynthesis C-methylase UbiE
MKLPNLLLLGLFLVGSSCAKMFPPYPCGPVLDKEGIQIFNRQNQYLGLTPGMTFADVGASSGYYDGAMAVFLDSVTFYLNDIDGHCLNEKNLNKVLRYYSKLRGSRIEDSNPFHYVIGTATHTNLPENNFDVIFCNATAHVLDYPDSIMTDLYGKLKAEGHLFVRDEFVYNGEVKKCASKKCGHQLLQYDSFVQLMNRNGFALEGESKDFGHPIYKFGKKEVR